VSYLVIARKWRPGLFEEVLGQEHVTRTLTNAISSGRIAHAYLFSGPRGVGKTTVARILAKSLNCEKGPISTPCNSCEACRGIANGSSVDVLEIDGASNTGVDNVRELRESVRYMPSQGRYRVYIIDEVHMLSTPAFNALLKTLEEPPAHVVFIFATTEPHKVPQTIGSRCQRFDFKRIPLKSIQDHLRTIAREEGIKVDEDALYLISREAEGSLRDAQGLLDQVIAFAGSEVKGEGVVSALGIMDRTVLFDLSRAILSRDGKRCLNIVEKIYNFGYDLKKVAGDLLEHIRDLTVIKVTGDRALLELPESEIEELKALQQGVGLDRLQMLFSILTRGYEEVSRASQPRFSLEMALLKAAHLEEIQSLTDLIARLEGLKETPGVAGGTKSGARDPAPGATVKKQGDPGGLMDHIKQKSRHLASFLESATFSIQGDVIDITLKGGSRYLQDQKLLLENICKEYFNKRVSVNIKTVCDPSHDGSGKGPATSPEDSLIREAVRIFGGKVIEDRGNNV
jgi:DNA polymerase-3 subunit gamma/tau